MADHEIEYDGTGFNPARVDADPDDGIVFKNSTASAITIGFSSDKFLKNAQGQYESSVDVPGNNGEVKLTADPQNCTGGCDCTFKLDTIGGTTPTGEIYVSG